MKLDDLVMEGFGRNTNIFRDFFKDITRLPNVDKLVAEHSTSRGHAFMIRGKDGNAYEIQIHPANHGDYFQDERKDDQYRERRNKEREKRQK